MKRTREERIALAARKKKAFRAQMSLKTRRAGTGLIMGTGGVAGSGVVRVPAGLPLAPEVKFQDGGFTTPGVGTAGLWTTMNSLIVASVVQGTGSKGFRIGKNIRIVGVLYRMAVVYGDSVVNGIPYTVDFIWDKKPTASAPTIAEIYDASAGSNLGTNLPNTNNETRFTWQKRYEKAPQTSQSLVAGSFKCNKFVSYSADTGALSDIEQNNLIVNFGHAANDGTNRAVVQGRIRILYVDA